MSKKKQQEGEKTTLSGKDYNPEAAKWRKDDSFSGIVRAFNLKQIAPRTLVAVKERLISLYKEGQITAEEQDFFETVMMFYRKKGQLGTADTYLLNEIEAAKCEDICWVAHDNAPTVLELKKDTECRFRMDVINDRVEVYVPRIIPGMFQISHEQAIQASHNQPITNMPPAKKVIKRHDLKRMEFLRWFRVQDDTILEQPAPTPVEAIF